MRVFLKESIKKLLGLFDLEIRKKNALKRYSFADALQHTRGFGFLPATVLDVGAAYGNFTLRCHSIFPNARYILIEPLKEYKSHLEKVAEIIPVAEYILSAAAARKIDLTINVHSDLAGSSLYLEKEASDVNGTPRVVSGDSLDNICENRNATGPYLIKVDVQGAELDVLSGANKILYETEYLILEVSLFEFFDGGPQLFDVIEYMHAHSFVVYDIFDLQYRPLDNALSQVDLAFVHDKSPFRKYHFYATEQQRAKQTKAFLDSQEKVIYR